MDEAKWHVLCDDWLRVMILVLLLAIVYYCSVLFYFHEFYGWGLWIIALAAFLGLFWLARLPIKWYLGMKSDADAFFAALAFFGMALAVIGIGIICFKILTAL